MPFKSAQSLRYASFGILIPPELKPAPARYLEPEALPQSAPSRTKKPGWFSGLAFFFHTVLLRQIKERRADALRSVPSHKGCYAWEGFNQKRLIGKAKLNNTCRICLTSASGVARISSDSISAGREASGAGFGCYTARTAVCSLANLPAIFIEVDTDRNAPCPPARRPSIIV